MIVPPAQCPAFVPLSRCRSPSGSTPLGSLFVRTTPAILLGARCHFYYGGAAIDWCQNRQLRRYAPFTHPTPAPAPLRPNRLARFLSLECCHTHTMLPGCGGGVAGRQRCVLPSHCGLTCNGSHLALNVGMASPPLPLPPPRPAAGLRSTCDPQCDAPSLPSDLAACARESFRRTGTHLLWGGATKGHQNR